VPFRKQTLNFGSIQLVAALQITQIKKQQVNYKRSFMPRHFSPLKSAIAFALGSALLFGCATKSVDPAVVETDIAESTTASQLASAQQLSVQSWFREARDIVAQTLGTDLSEIELQVTDSKGIEVHAKKSLMYLLSMRHR